MTAATLYPSEPSFQNKAQASAFLFPQRHGPAWGVKREKKLARLKMKNRPDVFAARKQYGSDTQRQYGKLGAASVVRRVEVPAVDATALVAQMEKHTARAEAQRLLGGRR